MFGEFGALYDESLYQDKRNWQKGFLSSFVGITGGGSANIPKSIISERGLGMLREPLVKYEDGQWKLPAKKDQDRR